MSLFCNSLTSRQIQHQLPSPSKASGVHVKRNKSCLQMASISTRPALSQSFALPPDNFSRYSKFLVKTSNVVDGMGMHHLLSTDSDEKEDLLPWVDTLDADKRHSYTLDQSKGDTKSLLNEPFSILSWNILAQSLYESHHRTRRIQQVALIDNQQFSSSSIVHPLPWHTRLKHILQTLSHSDADIICLQECELQSFTNDLVPSLSQLGYDGIAQEDCRKDIPARIKEASKHRDARNHIGATFWKRDKFEIAKGVDVSVRTRSLTTVLSVKEDNYNGGKSPSRNVAIVNCHLEGHPKRFLERTLQLQHALSDLAKMTTRTANKRSDESDALSGLNSLILAGDFNCELQSSACSTYLRMGRLGRHAGLGGIKGEDALVIPQALLETSEAAEVLHPIIEWGRALPEDKVGDIDPHPFRRNGMASAYPTWLGQKDATQHFTYCGETNRRPVPGLDQIWYSSMTLTRVGLKRMFADSGEWRCISDENVLQQLRDRERRKILSTGLPSPDGQYPSDHLPIGAVFDWKLQITTEEEEGKSSSRKHDEDSDERNIRRLQIVDEEGNNVEEAILQDEPSSLVDEMPPFETPKHELEFLVTNCPFDSMEQQSDVQFLLQPISPPIDLATKAKPTQAQLDQLDAKREKKAALLKSASLGVRPWLKKIWKVEKQVGKWERLQLKLLTESK